METDVIDGHGLAFKNILNVSLRVQMHVGRDRQRERVCSSQIQR
jgi:hypothetical protein